MPYTATVTKSNVTQADNYFNISVDVVINDGTSDIITTSASARYKDGTAPSEVTARLKTKIKAIWDKYVAEQAIYNAGPLDTAITTLNAELNAYIN